MWAYLTVELQNTRYIFRGELDAESEYDFAEDIIQIPDIWKFIYRIG
jgi:hypothetical protein